MFVILMDFVNILTLNVYNKITTILCPAREHDSAHPHTNSCHKDRFHDGRVSRGDMEKTDFRRACFRASQSISYMTLYFRYFLFAVRKT